MFKLLIVVVLYVNIAIEAKCPSNEALHPCDCHYDNIRCTGKTYYDLKQIFRSASNTLQDNEKHLKQFFLNNTAIPVLESDVFNNITFEEIIIDSAYNLTLISTNAFNKSNLYTKRVEIKSTPIQNNHSDYEIFHALTQMKELEEIHIFDADITSLPANVFQPINGVQSKLYRIFLSFNRFLTTIGDRAFYELNNLTIIDFLDNEINYIPRHLFDFRERIGEYSSLLIGLSGNKLNSSSFPSGAFDNAGRIYDIDLSGNKGLKYLDQNVFDFVLRNHTTINLRGIELDCDCRMYWIIENQQEYSKLIKDAICHDDYNLFIANRDEFTNCNVTIT